MYLRWKVQPAKRRGKTSYQSCYLVKSVRTPRGPRQRTVKLLSRIAEGDSNKAGPLVKFWQGVDANLSTLALDAGQQAKYKAAIAERVRRPTSGEAAEVAALLTRDGD
jgi:hypothetical protein